MFDDLAESVARRVSGETEVYGESSLERSLDWDGTVLKSSETSQGSGGMVRVCQGDTIGSAYATTDELDPERLVNAAVKSSEYLQSDPHRTLTGASAGGASSNRWFDGTIESVMAPRRKQIEDTIDQYSGRDSVRTLQVSYSEEDLESFLYRNGQPVSLGHRTRYSFHVWAVCERDGDVETGFDLLSSWKYDHLDFESVVNRAIRRGERQLGAEPASGWKGGLLLTAQASSTIMRLLRQLLDGESIVRGRSDWSTDRLGESIADPSITVIDDPAQERGAGNTERDAEGYTTDSVRLIENGKYRHFLTNQYVSSRADVENIHRADRSFRSAPEVGHTNLFIQPGTLSREELLSELGEGPVVTSIQPGSGMDAVSGHLSVGAEGYYRHGDGDRTPFSEATLSGDLEELLENVVGVGDELPEGRRLSAPAMLVDNMTVGGSD